eukprot:scaffold7594_cov111-Isochrysis_galbana.AAC.1
MGARPKTNPPPVCPSPPKHSPGIAQPGSKNSSGAVEAFRGGARALTTCAPSKENARGLAPPHPKKIRHSSELVTPLPLPPQLPP